MLYSPMFRNFSFSKHSMLVMHPNPFSPAQPLPRLWPVVVHRIIMPHQSLTTGQGNWLMLETWEAADLQSYPSQSCSIISLSCPLRQDQLNSVTGWTRAIAEHHLRSSDRDIKVEELVNQFTMDSGWMLLLLYSMELLSRGARLLASFI